MSDTMSSVFDVELSINKQILLLKIFSYLKIMFDAWLTIYGSNV